MAGIVFKRKNCCQGSLAHTSVSFQAQKYILQNVDGAVTVVSSYAGGGKTTLLLALVEYIRCADEKPLVFVCAPNHKNVNSTAAKLHGLGVRVASLGVDQDESVDLFQEYLESIAAKSLDPHAAWYAAVDAKLAEWKEHVDAERLSAALILPAACQLLAYRMIHLQTRVYPAIRAAHKEALASCLGCRALPSVV